MTRFARAKGSKASNERVPNEATPWHVMKEQLDDNIGMKKDKPAKAKSAKELLKEKDLFYSEAMGNVNNEWAEFSRPEVEKVAGKKQKDHAKSEITQKSKNDTIQSISEPISIGNGDIRATTLSHDGTVPKDKKSKKISARESSKDEVPVEFITNGDDAPKKTPKKRKSDASVKISETSMIEETEKNSVVNETPLKKKKKKADKNTSSTTEAVEIAESTKEPDPKVENSESNAATGKISKRHKRNQKRKNKIASEKAAADGTTEEKSEVTFSGGFDAAGNDWSSSVNFGKGKNETSKNEASDAAKTARNSKKPPNRQNGQQTTVAKRKAAKIRDDKEHKRRKPDSGSIKCVINGMDVEIVKYDGFPVKKEDAERLKDLKQQMIMKGIPKKEIDVAMKLERRKAEKSLARVRKQVCFHCRKAGHNLSDCPELGKEESATGICFKCGSTEHTHFECKVTKKEEFRFASCFICREQGHIAKQCPDNPRGLYPQGGACKICGDVTHLKKDCPDLTKEKEETSMTLSTIAENNLESLDDEPARKTGQDDEKKIKSKIVKF